MKKMLCMLMALVMMLGVFALPASAEEAVGTLYKLDGGYVDYVGMDYRYIVCGKSMGTDADGYPIIKYGAISPYGETVLDFEYDYATAPNQELFLVGKINYETGEIKEYILGMDNRPIDITQSYTVNGIYGGSIALHAGSRELSYFEIDPDTGAYRIVRKSINTNENLFEHECIKVSIPAYCVTDGLCYAYTDGTTMIITDGTTTKEFVAENENQMIVPAGFDNGCLFYGTAMLDYDTFEISDTVVYRYNLETGVRENLTDLYGASDFITSSGGVVTFGNRFIFNNEEGKYAYVDESAGVNTGYVFDNAIPGYGNDCFAVEIDGAYTYYTVDGKPTGNVYNDCTSFNYGKAAVTDQNGVTFVIGEGFERLSGNEVKLGSNAVLLDYAYDTLVVSGSRIDFYRYTDDPNFTIPGDVDDSGRLDVADIMLVKNCIMLEHFDPAADYDADGKVNVADIMCIKAVILSN